MERLKTTEEIRLERATKRVHEIKGYYKHLAAYILVNAFLISMSYFRLKEGETLLDFSNFSVAFFWGIGLVFHTIGVFGKNIFLGSDWEEKKIKEFMDKNENTTKWE